jgi:hypothetical protein
VDAVGGDQTRTDNDTAQERLSQVADHMNGGAGSSKGSGKKGKSSLLEKHPDDVSTVPLSLLRREPSDEQELFDL